MKTLGWSLGSMGVRSREKAWCWRVPGAQGGQRLEHFQHNELLSPGTLSSQVQLLRERSAEGRSDGVGAGLAILYGQTTHTHAHTYTSLSVCNPRPPP